VLIRKEGIPYIGISTLFSWSLSRTRLGYIGWVPALFTTYFFRDPKRYIPDGDGLILSPADGRVIGVLSTSEELVGPCFKVSIFMSIFNVHINRAIVDGVVVGKRYRPGEFHLAFLGKKTDANERMILYVENSAGVFRVDQVAGLVARRIVCWPGIGDRLSKGQRIGLIQFGSLLECYIPSSIAISVKKGDRVQAGQSILGRYMV